MTRRVPADSINLFRLISLLIRDYEERTGRACLDLSIGKPDSVPPPELLSLQAQLAADPTLKLHTYAMDNDLAGFTASMVELHSRLRLSEHEHLAVLPIPGIKTATALLPLACGLHQSGRKRRDFHVVTNQPAFDIGDIWHGSYFGGGHVVWPLSSRDGMRLKLSRLHNALEHRGVDRAEMILTIRPGNPAPVGANREEWKGLIEHCVARGTRLVNDAAYTGLTDPAGDGHVPLASVAMDYPDLEWLEMYSVSKSFSDPGARLGAVVGSKDFVEDFKTIKGNTDAGPVPYVMAAYGTYFQDRRRVEAFLAELRSMYERRVRYLVDRLQGAGFEPACIPESGLFTLWQIPRHVLGVDLAKDASTADFALGEAFNRTVIRETGIVGVHFQVVDTDGVATPMIRYAACTDVLRPEFQKPFERQLLRLRPRYT